MAVALGKQIVIRLPCHFISILGILKIIIVVSHGVYLANSQIFFPVHGVRELKRNKMYLLVLLKKIFVTFSGIKFFSLQKITF